MRHLAIATFSAVMFVACTAATETPPAEKTRMIMDDTGFTEPAMIYEVDFKSVSGEPMPFRQFEGQAVLVVNTASRCGYTSQYAGLQELHETFKDQGFSVLGVPSNDFGGQEPGTEEQIKAFCEMNFGVTFPLTSKVHAVGPNQHAFWQVAKKELGEKAEPNWNFHKVLVGPDGAVLQAYPSGVKPADAELVADIERALSMQR
jgi:glutathione peroxidase